MFSDSAFTFYLSDCVRKTEFRGNTQEQVYMIRHRMAFMQFKPFLMAQASYYSTYFSFHCSRFIHRVHGRKPALPPESAEKFIGYLSVVESETDRCSRSISNLLVVYIESTGT